MRDDKEYVMAVLSFANSLEFLKAKMASLESELRKNDLHAEAAKIYSERLVILPSEGQVVSLFGTCEHLYKLQSLPDETTNEC